MSLLLIFISSFGVLQHVFAESQQKIHAVRPLTQHLSPEAIMSQQVLLVHAKYKLEEKNIISDCVNDFEIYSDIHRSNTLNYFVFVPVEGCHSYSFKIEDKTYTFPIQNYTHWVKYWLDMPSSRINRYL